MNFISELEQLINTIMRRRTSYIMNTLTDDEILQLINSFTTNSDRIKVLIYLDENKKIPPIEFDTLVQLIRTQESENFRIHVLQIVLKYSKIFRKNPKVFEKGVVIGCR